MSSNHCYHFRLVPLGKFFFGNERTFGQGAETNYLVRSNAFPQQTTLLGMLRYELLKLENKLPLSASNQEEIINLIGEGSFNHTKTRAFGNVLRLSPVMLNNGQNDWQIAARNLEYPIGQFGTEKALLFSWNAGKLEGYARKQPVGSIFDHKKYYQTQLITLNGSQQKPQSEVLIEDSQIGITKPDRGQTEEKGFYKQYFYRMKKGWAFSFFAEFSKAFSWQSTTVFIGADRSAFRLEVKKSTWPVTFEKNDTPSTKATRVTLLSDAYLLNPYQLYASCHFAVADTTDFRYLQTEVKNGYTPGQKPVKTNQKLYLLQRGSVLFPSDWTKLLEQLNNSAFQNIGYNHYIID